MPRVTSEAVFQRFSRKATSKNLNRVLNVGYPVRGDRCMTLVAGYKKIVVWRIGGQKHMLVETLLRECYKGVNSQSIFSAPSAKTQLSHLPHKIHMPPPKLNRHTAAITQEWSP